MSKLQTPSSNFLKSFESEAPILPRRPKASLRGFLTRVCGSSLARGALSSLLFAPALVLAEPPAATTDSISSRYLFIVDTSRAMQPRAAGVQRAVRDLLSSGMGGQMRRGDTLGIWIFNEDLYTGRLPLQKWSPEAKDEIILRVDSFIKDQRYEKKANLQKVLPTLRRIIQASQFLTIVIFSDGDEKIQGTPFDDRINGFYSQWRAQQRKAQMPLLTVLRAGGGRLTNFRMNTAPWPVDMPPLAPEISALAAAEKEAGQAPQKVQTSSVPPLIISGRKLREEQAAMANAEVSASAGAPVPVTGSNSPPANPGPEPTPPVTDSSPKAPSGTSVPVPDANQPTTPPAELAATTPAEPPKPRQIEPVAPEPDSSVKKKSVLPDTQTTSVVSPPASTTASNPATKPLAAVGSGSRLSGNLIWIAGLFLIAAGVVLTVLLIRRSRAVPRVSLITRSLEREKKP